MNTQVDLVSIHDTAVRCRVEGIPLSETALRRLVKAGEIPAVKIGNKALLYWPNVTRFVEAGNSGTVSTGNGGGYGSVRAVNL